MRMLWAKVLLIFYASGAGHTVVWGQERVPETRAWDFTVFDTRGRPVGPRYFKGQVTLVTIADRAQADAATKLGHALGESFGRREGYQTIVVANTSQLSFLLRPFAAGKVEQREKEAVARAVRKQRAAGHKQVSRESVSRVLRFVHDKDGHVLHQLKLDPSGKAAWVLVVGPKRRIVFDAPLPVAESAVVAAIEAALAKR